MNLEIERWKEFSLSDIFTKVEPGKVTQAYQLEEGSDIPYLGAKKEDNGVMAWCAANNALKSKGNCVVLICDGQGSVGLANYMESDFLGTVNLMLCYNDRYLNKYTGLFLATIFSQERPKYSFGRKWKTHLGDMKVMLPQTEAGKPDWGFMECYIRALHSKPITTKNADQKTSVLDIGQWKHFFLKDICSISMGNKLDYAVMTTENPSVNFVGRSAENEGVMGKVDAISDVVPYKAGSISVALGGSLGSSFVQTEDFYTSQNVSVLEFEDSVSIYAKLFITTCIMFESRYKYFPFGRELNTHIKTDFGFVLPIKCDSKGTPIIDETRTYSPEGYIPDWEYMEQYVKSLPYSDRIER